jgi:uncharacterized protein YbcI
MAKGSTDMAATLNVPTGQSPTSAISNLVVKTMREYTGRGPTKARTVLSEHSAHVVLEQAMLLAERNLVDSGHGEVVLDIRRRFQQAMREPLVKGVEEITGRKVDAFLSDNHIDPDIAVETFIFESRDRGGVVAGDGDGPAAQAGSAGG